MPALKGVHAHTPARRRGEALLGQAIKEHWSAQKLAREARISPTVASDMIKGHVDKIKKTSGIILETRLARLVDGARKVQDAEIAMIERQLALNERLMKQAESGQDLSAKELKDIVSVRSMHQKMIESVTGLDVAKAIAVRKATDTKGAMLAWDGVECIESSKMPFLELGEYDEPSIVQEEPPAIDPLDDLFSEDPLAELW